MLQLVCDNDIAEIEEEKQNIVAKYFLKGKTLFTNTVHVFLCFD